MDRTPIEWSFFFSILINLILLLLDLFSLAFFTYQGPAKIFKTKEDIRVLCNLNVTSVTLAIVTQRDDVRAFINHFWSPWGQAGSKLLPTPCKVL